MNSPLQSLRSDLDAPQGDAIALVTERVHLLIERRLRWLETLAAELSEVSASAEILRSDRSADEAEFYASDPRCTAWNRQLAAIDLALAGRAGQRFRDLGELFALTQAELDVIQIALVLAYEPRLAETLARLNGSERWGYLTAHLVARLLGHSLRSLCCFDGNLAKWGLVRQLEQSLGDPPALVIDPSVASWLQGQVSLDRELVGRVVPIVPCEPLSWWPIDDLVASVLKHAERDVMVRMVVAGAPGSGRRTLSACVARALGRAAFFVDIAGLDGESRCELKRRALRFASFSRAFLVWEGNDASVDVGVPTQPLQFVIAEEDRVPSESNQVVDVVYSMGELRIDERIELWAQHAEPFRFWPAAVQHQIAARHRLNIGDIIAIGRQAPESAEMCSTLAKERKRHHLGELGKLIECPFAWDDLVVAARLREELEDFAFEAATRVEFWEGEDARRLFPRGTGQIGLMVGPPGTGKTMAAQVIARQLDLDLIRIDLASVLSKYIGETAKNLGKIFSRAARMNAVLFFDEADALFSKRTDVSDSHDRHANTDTNYLLQLIEDYRGVALLVTNKKRNIDGAFLRRVRYVFDFRLPAGPERLQIWRSVVGTLVGVERRRTLEPTLAALAESVDMSGAEIKNALLGAIFIARRHNRSLSMRELLVACTRELQKSGRVIGSSERERLLRYV
jgi:hypothetical protein